MAIHNDINIGVFEGQRYVKAYTPTQEELNYLSGSGYKMVASGEAGSREEGMDVYFLFEKEPETAETFVDKFLLDITDEVLIESILKPLGRPALERLISKFDGDPFALDKFIEKLHEALVNK